MFEFYRENVKYYLTIALYRYVPHLILALLLFIFSSIVFGGLLLLKSDLITFSLMKITVVSIAVSPLVIGILMLLFFSLKFIFITGYSFVKYLIDESRFGKIFWSHIKRFITSPKILLLALVIIILGYVMYSQILPDIVPPAEIDNVILSLALTLLIYGVLLFLFRTRHVIVSLVRALWEYFPGLVWRLLVALALITSQLVLLAAIYLVVSAILVPMILK